jgi:hypothetical protein
MATNISYENTILGLKSRNMLTRGGYSVNAKRIFTGIMQWLSVKILLHNENFAF